MTPDLELERPPLYHQQIIFIKNEIKDSIEWVDEDTIKNYYTSTDDTINNLLITLWFSYSWERRLSKIEELYQNLLQSNDNKDEITITDLNTWMWRFHELLKNK
jgi:hypothetical protein